MPSRDKLSEFTAGCQKHITGDEKSDAQIFLDHLFQAFGHAGGGTSFADLDWKSHAHWLWFITKCSKLTERFNYTSSTVFDRFPSPLFEESREENEGSEGKKKTSPPSRPSRDTLVKIDAVAAARELRRVRVEALPKLKGDLRALYRTLELPDANPSLLPACRRIIPTRRTW